MRGLDESKHSIERVLDSKRPRPEVRRLIGTFHEALTRTLDQRYSAWQARVHVNGIMYFCNDKKGFVCVDVRQKFLTIGFFTGDATIDGLKKANWMTATDYTGSEGYRVYDAETLQRAVVFAVKAYDIAADWGLGVPSLGRVAEPLLSSDASSGDVVIEAHPKNATQSLQGGYVDSSRQQNARLQGGELERAHLRRIVENAVEATQARWVGYEQSWTDIDAIFIKHGYEQQGFRIFRFAPYLEKRGLLCIDALGSILEDGQQPQGYSKSYANGLDAPFYQQLRSGAFGENGKAFAEVTQEFKRQEPANCGRFYWKLLWQMLQACAYLRCYHHSSFAEYVVGAYGRFVQRPNLSETEFLAISQAEWLAFLEGAQPWRPLSGIGENVFDFIFGDIVEARFARDSFKLDSANEYFLKVTGIGSLIGSLERDSVIEFLRSLELPYTLREINKGIYTYCSKTEAANFGFCRNVRDCQRCAVAGICLKLI